MSCRPQLKQRSKRHRGVAAIEAALVLPIVVLLTFGYIELGWYVNSLQVLHNAARQGARAAVRIENSNAEVQSAVLTSLLNARDVDPETVSVRISKLNWGGGEDYQVMNLSANEQGHPICVEVTIEYGQMRPPCDFLGLGVNTISSSVVMQRAN
ncbi:MAG: TadE/TadG family type IV pilus assembly protein [Pirellulaceae bacterium]|nr:TadE/TadG family type IV pilus assembly protein [Pirellulaceae bacterium]MDP6553823.1 TadE/TadG family type IV pilus assembly protein [Pirellulaceae bacterium]